MTHRNLAVALQNDGRLVISDVGDPVELWIALRRFYMEHRPVVSTSARGWPYPATTNADVRQVTDLWTQLHRKIWRSGLATSRSWDAWWQESKSQVEMLTAGAEPSLVYKDNENFWLRQTKRHAQQLAVIYDSPRTRYELASDAIAAAVRKVPELPGMAVDFLETGAKNAGRLARAPFSGFLDGLGLGWLKRPLAYTALGAAVVVGGLVVVPKLVRSRRLALSPGGGS